MYQKLAQYLSQFKDINEEDHGLIRKYFKSKEFKKGAMLVEEGQVCDEIFFIEEGYFHVFILSEEIEEKTIHIAGKGDFVSGLSSFLSREPSIECVRAITDAQALSIKYDDLQAIYNSSKDWERFGRIVMENLFVRKQKRVISFIKHSADIRYENLMKNNPEFIQNIPLRIIASYLGVKPETLSRIRAKIS